MVLPVSQDAISAKLAALHARPIRQGPRWPRVLIWMAVGLAIAAGLLSLWLVGSHEYDAMVRNPRFCPSASSTGGVVGLGLSAVSVIHKGDLLSCSYSYSAGGPDILSLDIAATNTVDLVAAPPPCLDRPAITVDGHTACDMSGTPGTGHRGPSLLVVDGAFEFQFTSYTNSIPMWKLVTLADTIFAPHHQLSA